MKLFSQATIMLATLLLLPLTLFAATNISPTQFQVTEKTEIPGHTLKPGSYSMTVVDQLPDRMVLRILDDSGKEEATFLAVAPTSRFPTPASQGPVTMRTKGGHTALRGFKFSSGTVAEFVYLKAQAVSLARANNITVTAVDPPSDGRSASPNLSKTDRELVTLWMLTPTTIGPNNQPAVEAERYQVATVTPPPPPPAAQRAPTGTYLASQIKPKTVKPQPVLEAKAEAPTGIKPVRTIHAAALPHTASNTFAIALTGFIAAFSAAFLAFRRRAGAPTR